MQVKTAHGEEPVHGREILLVVRDADVLEHSDRSNLVECPLYQREVAKLQSYLLLQAKPGDFAAREMELLLRQRNAVRLDTEVLGGMTNERSPTTTDVEKAITRLEAKLAAYHVELVMLGVCDFVFPISKIRAAVNHLWIEKEGVERVGDVIVIVDVLGVRDLAAVGPRAIAHCSSGQGPPRDKKAKRGRVRRSKPCRGSAEFFWCAPWVDGPPDQKQYRCVIEPTGHPKISHVSMVGRRISAARLRVSNGNGNVQPRSLKGWWARQGSNL